VVKGLNSTFHFNPLVTEFTLSDRVGGGNSGNGLSALWGEGRTERREGDVEMKEVSEEGKEM